MKEIVLIGTGNVAHHLAKAFAENDVPVQAVYGRNIVKAKVIADAIQTEALDDLSRIAPDSTCIIAVADDAIESIVAALPSQRVAHTSGSKNLIERSAPSAVFYPLQTFSKSRPVDFESIPLLLESNDLTFLEELKEIAGRISRVIVGLDSEKRALLHVGAVISSNFTNHLYHLAERWLREQGIPFELLHPLLDETLDKMKSIGAYEAQTGPAKRGDLGTISKHLKHLENEPDLKALYEHLSKNIAKAHGTEL